LPLRFLSEYFGYRVSWQGDTVSIDSPLSEKQQILYGSDLAAARKLAIGLPVQYMHQPLETSHRYEDYSLEYLFPEGEVLRFVAFYGNETISLIEFRDEFPVVVWQAHSNNLEEDVVKQFLNGRIKDETGPAPMFDSRFAYYGTGIFGDSWWAKSGIYEKNLEFTETGYVHYVSSEVDSQSGSVSLTIPGEVRNDQLTHILRRPVISAEYCLSELHCSHFQQLLETKIRRLAHRKPNLPDFGIPGPPVHPHGSRIAGTYIEPDARTSRAPRLFLRKLQQPFLDFPPLVLRVYGKPMNAYRIAGRIGPRQTAVSPALAPVYDDRPNDLSFVPNAERRSPFQVAADDESVRIKPVPLVHAAPSQVRRNRPVQCRQTFLSSTPTGQFLCSFPPHFAAFILMRRNLAAEWRR
jgi:hypothetical protein